MNAVVEIDNLTKDYEVGFVRKRKVRALDGLSLSVNQGEIFGFPRRKWRRQNYNPQAANAFDVPDRR